MSLRVLATTIFCLVYVVTQGSTSHIKTIRRITYDEDHYEPYHHQKKVKKTCNCVYHDEQLPEISFYQVGEYLIGEEVAPQYRKKDDDLPALDPRLLQEDDRLSALDPQLIKFINDVISQEQNTLPALDPRLKSSDGGKNSPQENPTAENPTPENPALDPRLQQEDDNLPALDPRLIKFINDVIRQSQEQNTLPALDPRLQSSDSEKNPPPPENPTPENPALDPRLTTSNSEKTPTPVNPSSENPTPENSPETEPVITPDQ